MTGDFTAYYRDVMGCSIIDTAGDIAMIRLFALAGSRRVRLARRRRRQSA